MCKVSHDRPIWVLTLDIFATLEKAFYLLSYAHRLAQVFIEAPSPILACAFCHNMQVLDFLDVDAM